MHKDFMIGKSRLRIGCGSDFKKTRLLITIIITIIYKVMPLQIAQRIFNPADLRTGGFLARNIAFAVGKKPRTHKRRAEIDGTDIHG